MRKQLFPRLKGTPFLRETTDQQRRKKKCLFREMKLIGVGGAGGEMVLFF
jgi:hypothetical protein